MKPLATSLLLISLVSLFRQLHGQCPSHQFKCANERCVPLTWRCDEDDDCGDGSDEQKCEIRTCAVTEFKCANEKCVPKKWQCDGDDDCGDRSDEDCRNKTCGSDQFMCEIGVCIPISWRCDGSEDCRDGSDEKVECHATTCAEDEFTCKNNVCIWRRWVCDKDDDCGDGSDEINCPNVTCSSSEFMCADGKCIPAMWRCDGQGDCFNNSDEVRCPGSPSRPRCSPREFLCANQRDCILDAWKCNGEADCPDGSDELNCTQLCRHDQYMCRNHQCISGHMRCNGQKECRDGSDEENCPVNECIVNNGGCSQICVDELVGYSCECHKGFKLVENRTCEDINECETPGTCSQICINMKGHYKCECEDGYVLEPNSHHRCKAQEGHAALLFANRHDIRKINLETFKYKAVVSSLRNAVGLDYVFHTGTVIWSDVTEECIKSAPIDTGEPVAKIIDKGIITPDGIAVDWIYNHIYWTDTAYDTIMVSDMGGSFQKTLISVELDEPRAIVVNPLEGWLFWTDWGVPSKIERAGMDGSHRETIVSANLKWPNGLAIDYISRRIFWMDAQLHQLASCNYDGTNQRIILSAIHTIKRPFAIDVFEDWIYWTDWESEAIHKVNKFTGKEISNVTVGIYSPMGIRVYHPYKQPKGTNYCKTMRFQCSYLCLPAPAVSNNSVRYSCACPDDMTLADDQRNCIYKATTTHLPKPVSTQASKIPLPVSTTTARVTTTATIASKASPSLSSTTVSSTLATHLPKPVSTQASKIPSPISTTTFHAKTAASASKAFPSLSSAIASSTLASAISDTTSEVVQTEPSKIPETPTLIPDSNDSTSEMQIQTAAAPLEETLDDADTGRIAGIIIGVLGGLAIITTVVAFLLYKQYLRRNVTSMNFDNPVYRKTTEDQFSLEKNQYQPARSYPPGLEPLTSPGTNEFV